MPDEGSKRVGQGGLKNAWWRRDSRSLTAGFLLIDGVTKKKALRKVLDPVPINTDDAIIELFRPRFVWRLVSQFTDQFGYHAMMPAHQNDLALKLFLRKSLTSFLMSRSA